MGVISIWSSPQSAKTALCTDLATVLAKDGKTVCVISADDYGILATRFGIRIPKEKGLHRVTSPRQNIAKLAVEGRKGVELLAPSTEGDAFDCVFSKEQAKKLLLAAAAAWDVVLVDCTSDKGNAITGESLALCKSVIIPISGMVSWRVWYSSNKSILKNLRGKAHYVEVATVKHFDYYALRNSVPEITVEHALPFVAGASEIANSGKLLYEDGGRTYQKAIAELGKGAIENGWL